MKTSVIPVIVEAHGTISCETEDYINSIPGPLQIATILEPLLKLIYLICKYIVSSDRLL